ncbi:Transposase subunit [Pseudomonas syringae pv. helianthi]|uniref:Transposase subunit n=2 Tax=Pseudomonas syringae group genomosp. 7 TaxID=251699 RepID=A0A0P9TRN0_9PSED|nr:Transposase subunit [Pseudomonas syringae pv. helianthi]KPY80527.1 hypothetical protein ALO44_200073 [Pseudomonas syringae pv. tagetis]RMR03068.1 hypothetical protein ALP93_200190 [Pseudomonas syringae pv. helianthi]RMW26040.1 hypothetical protein ALO97_200140 [Pseudomonas syringae pv. tagetis]UNB65992.1 hypothetical protein MME54_00175 [Pseudomonas syringae pv. helianthi]
MRMHGVIKALSEQHATPNINNLKFGERLGLMVDCEVTDHEDAPYDHSPQIGAVAPQLQPGRHRLS